ncbi:MAG: hypothetical protein IPP88_16955 [Betaproteobacteria bacterium]|nr:hypothetical protein [Betaproteobacteria bacterium]
MPIAPPAPDALMVLVKFPVPLVGMAVAKPGVVELITLLELPPEILITPVPPSGMQSAEGATLNGSTGAAVPGVVVTSNVTKAPKESVTTTLPGDRQILGLNTCTENASPLLSTSGGVIVIELGKLVLALYGAIPPNTNKFTNPVPQAAVVGPPRLTFEGSTRVPRLHRLHS